MQISLWIGEDSGMPIQTSLQEAVNELNKATDSKVSGRGGVGGILQKPERTAVQMQRPEWRRDRQCRSRREEAIYEIR